MTALDTINSLFLSDGLFSYIGLVIIILLFIVITGIKKEAIALTLPMCGLVALVYLDAGLGWHFLLMILNAVFLLVEVGMSKK